LGGNDGRDLPLKPPRVSTTNQAYHLSMEDMPWVRCPGCDAAITVCPSELVQRVDHGTVGGGGKDTEKFLDVLERWAAAAGLRLALCDDASRYTCPVCGRRNHWRALDEQAELPPT
jgi:ferredoxin